MDTNSTDLLHIVKQLQAFKNTIVLNGDRDKLFNSIEKINLKVERISVIEENMKHLKERLASLPCDKQWDHIGDMQKAIAQNKVGVEVLKTEVRAIPKSNLDLFKSEIENKNSNTKLHTILNLFVIIGCLSAVISVVVALTSLP